MIYEKIGIVGLGHMGGPIAANLLKSGKEVIAYDAAGSKERAPQGAIPANDIQEVAQADIVVLSLPNGDISKSVCSQLAETPNKRVKVIVDLSTIGIPAAEECAVICEKHNINYVDSPVSGAQKGAIEGTLTLMIAAKKELIEEARPVLECFSKNIFHIGDKAGQGQAMKLVNNFLASSIMTVTCEAVTAGLNAGLDLKQMIDVINVSTGRSFMSEIVFPANIIPGTYDSGFATALLTKDILLYESSIDKEKTPHYFADVAIPLWQKLLEQSPGSDNSEIFKLMSNQLETANK